MACGEGDLLPYHHLSHSSRVSVLSRIFLTQLAFAQNTCPLSSSADLLLILQGSPNHHGVQLLPTVLGKLRWSFLKAYHCVWYHYIDCQVVACCLHLMEKPNLAVTSVCLPRTLRSVRIYGCPINIFKIFYFIYLFWLCQVLVAAHRIFHLPCGMWDLVPHQGSDLGPLHWECGASH